MAIRQENDCFGCDWPGGCSGCSKKHDYNVVSCDECKKDIDEYVYISPAGDCLCYKCASKQFEYDENDEWINEDEWEVKEPGRYAEDEEEAAEEAYWDWKCDEIRDRELFDDYY